MSEPVHIAAIDAGSNAVRLSVARAYSALDIEPIHVERYPLRLGESVFVRHRFSEEIFKKAAKAFRIIESAEPIGFAILSMNAGHKSWHNGMA